MNIAIDGPAGAGKSTIARLAAKKLGFLYVDTGAMYRAIALYLLWNETDIDDEEIYVDFGTSISPCVIRPIENEDYTYMILPIRMKE